MTPTTSTEVRTGFLSTWGYRVLHAIEVSGEGLMLLGRTLGHLGAVWSKRSEIVTQMLICGVYSLPTALLVATFSGMVIALQVGILLEEWGEPARVGAVVAVTMCRELGPVWVAMILAARVGSAMAAELGSMRVSEEIDALEVMSIDPAKFLVLPRVLALTVMAPVLTAYADFIGTLGGALVGRLQFGVPYSVYFRWAERNLTNKDIFSGLLIKAPVFGLIIAVVGCTLGLRVRPSDGVTGVGTATRNSVVVALMLIIAFNYFLTSFIRYL